MAFQCLAKAAECDPSSTQVAADLLKTRLRLANRASGADAVAVAADLSAALIATPPIAEQRPRGGDDYERLARVTEYLTLLSLQPEPEASWLDGATDELVLARELLLDVFMHTDSINVRKAQAHRYLMKPATRTVAPFSDQRVAPTPKAPENPASETVGAPLLEPGKLREIPPAIEFVCMRRYSSAFPVVPRPSAFRAHGGGYFVRLHPSYPLDQDDRERTDCVLTRPPGPTPTGIVVDPGPDFVENFFRTGFSLADIHMVIITHDHVDHMNSLEPLLALLHYRGEILARQDPPLDADTPHEDEHGPKMKSANPDPVIVYGNKSIRRRYKHVSQLNPGRLRFRSLKKIDRETDVELHKFRIVPMSSAKVAEPGHTDLSVNPAFGVCFVHDDPKLSLAITSDTPAPPDRGDTQTYETWCAAWNDALIADVLVAHLSTVPLPELRQLADVGTDGPLRPADFTGLRRRVDVALDDAAAASTQILLAEAKAERALEDIHDPGKSKGFSPADGLAAKDHLDGVKQISSGLQSLIHDLRGLAEDAAALLSEPNLYPTGPRLSQRDIAQVRSAAEAVDKAAHAL
jgi:hypothetical protein